jgi:hypothetical protein
VPAKTHGHLLDHSPPPIDFDARVMCGYYPATGATGNRTIC